jgi:transposase, IS5 family
VTLAQRPTTVKPLGGKSPGKPVAPPRCHQAKARIFRGDTRSEGKIVSIFEPSTEVTRKGKASRSTEFGKLVKLQEAENQIVIDYEVYAAKLGCIPRLVAADAGFHSAKNEAAAKAKGVRRVCVPNRAGKSAAGSLRPF